MKYRLNLLTRMPSQRDTARSGLKALSVLIERNAGISAAPAIIAPKLINESFKVYTRFILRVLMLCANMKII